MDFTAKQLIDKWLTYSKKNGIRSGTNQSGREAEDTDVIEFLSGIGYDNEMVTNLVSQLVSTSDDSDDDSDEYIEQPETAHSELDDVDNDSSAKTAGHDVNDEIPVGVRLVASNGTRYVRARNGWLDDDTYQRASVAVTNELNDTYFSSYDDKEHIPDIKHSDAGSDDANIPTGSRRAASDGAMYVRMRDKWVNDNTMAQASLKITRELNKHYEPTAKPAPPHAEDPADVAKPEVLSYVPVGVSRVASDGNRYRRLRDKWVKDDDTLQRSSQSITNELNREFRDKFLNDREASQRQSQQTGSPSDATTQQQSTGQSHGADPTELNNTATHYLNRIKRTVKSLSKFQQQQLYKELSS